MSAPDQIAAALAYDPLSAAEKITGDSYKDSRSTLALGFALSMDHNAHKEQLLRETSDSHFNTLFVDQLALFAELGFTEVYRETFDGTYGRDTYVILWHADGILATCESHAGTHRNTAKVYYNFREADGGYPGYPLTSSGGMRGEVWVGYHDVREGVRHKLDALRAAGEFLPEWVERPFLWLLNYSEGKGDYDYDAINTRKIARLPEHVRNAITPDGEVTP